MAALQVPGGVAVELAGDETESKGPASLERGVVGVSETKGKRTGTAMWTATLTTAVMGYVVLSLVWALAQLGWVVGLAVMLLFSAVTYYTPSPPLAVAAACSDDAGSDSDSGSGGKHHRDMSGICELFHLADIFGLAIELTSTACAIICDMIRRRTRSAAAAAGQTSIAAWCMIIFGFVHMVLTQIVVTPHLDQIPWLSILAAVMFVIYCTIVVGLSILQIIGNGGVVQGSLGGVVGHNPWRVLQALGDIALAYAATSRLGLVPDEPGDGDGDCDADADADVGATVRRRGSAVTTVFTVLCVCAAVGYAALGGSAPGNLLAGLGRCTTTTGSSSSSSSGWLLDVAGAAAVVHLAIEYQVRCQPLFAAAEKLAVERGWPLSGAVDAVAVNVPLYYYDVHGGGGWRTTAYELKVWRTAFVVAATAACVFLLPTAALRRDAAGLLGAAAFWPRAVYVPVETYVARKGVARWGTTWVCLQLLSLAGLLFSVAIGIGYVAGIVNHATHQQAPAA